MGIRSPGGQELEQEEARTRNEVEIRGEGIYHGLSLGSVVGRKAQGGRRPRVRRKEERGGGGR